MLIYRFENSRRVGPYNCNKTEKNRAFLRGMIRKHHYKNCLIDVLSQYDNEEPPSKYKCACLSLSDLEEWFSGYVLGLFWFNFKIVYYEVKDEFTLLDRDGLQVIFQYKKAKRKVL